MRMNWIKKKGPVFILLTLLLAFYVFSESVNLNPLYAEGAMFWCVTISIYLVTWVVFKYGTIFAEKLQWNTQNQQSPLPLQSIPKLKMPKWTKFAILLPWLFFVVMIIISSPLISWKAYRDQMPEPDARSFSSDIQAVDIKQVPIVDKDLAMKLADKKLGERPSLGSQVYLGEPTIQRVNGELLWVAPLQHSGFFKWLTNMSGTPGYVTVSATNVNDVQYVEGYKIKYQPNSYLLDDLTRNVRFTAAPFSGIVDYSFELDETGKPYWVVTTYKNMRGFALPEATGAIVVDATTGDKQTYTIANIPDWVDRVQPEEFIVQQFNNKGNYVHGIFNFANKDKYRSSNGEIIVYNEGRCYLFTGLTSVGTDESAIGFVMVDMVTKESQRYQISGATEASARKSAEGKVQNLRYTASFPLILNVDGHPTYFMTLKDNEGLIKQYAYVSVVNYSIVGTGETMQAAMNNYNKGMKADGGLPNLDGSSQATAKTTPTKVLRIAAEYNGDETVYKLILENYEDFIFVIPANLSDQLALTVAGDTVVIDYYPSEGQAQNGVAAFSNSSLPGASGAVPTPPETPVETPPETTPETTPAEDAA